MMPAAALLLALASLQAPAGDEAVAKAAAGSPFIFAQACLLRLNVSQPPAAYATGSDELGRGILADTPTLKGVLAIDGADGNGCRVRYSGPQFDAAWKAYAAAYAKLTSGPAPTCSPAATTSADLLSAACVSQGEVQNPRSATRRATLTIQRSVAGTQGMVTASLTDIRP